MNSDMRTRALMIAVPALVLIGSVAGCSSTATPAAQPTAAASATGSPAATTSTTKPAGTATTGGTEAAACTSADMKTTVTAQSDGGDTLQKGLVTLTNTGKAVCTLDGWVAISLVNAADEVVPVPTRKVPQPGPAEAFTVKPGTSAFAGFTWTTCDKGDASCGVGNTLRYNLEASTDGPVAELEGFPAGERSGITMKSLTIGTLQPSRQGVVAW
ncbi:DUF4232 domain-containing protein [Actinoplanes palleronii]|nr:DUF4232 domain-containing protein [Actinoplanes palleronii]